MIFSSQDSHSRLQSQKYYQKIQGMRLAHCVRLHSKRMVQKWKGGASIIMKKYQYSKAIVVVWRYCAWLTLTSCSSNEILYVLFTSAPPLSKFMGSDHGNSAYMMHFNLPLDRFEQAIKQISCSSFWKPYLYMFPKLQEMGPVSECWTIEC